MMNPLISAAELVAQEGHVIVVDVRHDLNDPTAGLLGYASGHLPQAVFLSVDEDLSGEATALNGGRHPLPSPENFIARLNEIGGTDETLFIAYDDSGGAFAARFWWLCRWVGHLKVGVLNGGLKAWTAAGGLLQADEPLKGSNPGPKRAGKIAIRPSLSPRWNLHAMEAWVATGSPREIALVLDARSLERYRGDQEPFDPVAGHIPGAFCRPSSANLDAEGYFKPASQLREEFEQLLQGQEPTEVIHSCGSGITACHNLLAMEAAGLTGSSLYPGSWSEWCAASHRPVAVG
ncbi:MAG: sulfurtransferase [Burkholderiaceae bacterium]|nr:sulfurtransferase [Burkholderiaceae bacterium]